MRVFNTSGPNIPAKHYTEDLIDASLETLVARLEQEFRAVGITLSPIANLGDFTNFITNLPLEKLVFIVDEIEGLNPNLLGQFLHSIRSLYHSRDKHPLKSTILVGVSNIVGVIEDNASPFNIADTLQAKAI